MSTLSKTSVTCIFLLSIVALRAQITWPQGQLLPSFPESAATQDLIYINGSITPYAKTWTWQAEGAEVSHETGRLDGDGWLCQTGVDVANKYMVYGPYSRDVTAGPNVAEFLIKVDNNSADNVAIVDIDVRNSTSGVTLASQTITRSQFTSANNYVSFKLDFQMPADSQAIELRVLWKGNAYTKVNYVSVKQNNSDAELYLFSSMKGIVNRTQPRIFSYEGDAFAEGPYTWLQCLGKQYNDNKSNTWSVLTKYLSEISGLIVYDPAQIHTVNLATRLAKDYNALIASPSLIHRLTAAPYNLPILLDLRGQFASKQEIYQYMFDNYWENTDKRLIIGLNPEAHKGSLREYAVALGAATIWLDPKKTAESTLLNKFFASMPAGSNYMGWWPEEQAGVERCSTYGLTTIASDFCTNLTFHSGLPRSINPRPMPAKPALQNKIYVAFILSDGDNIQYVEHLMRKLWNNSDRGSVPIGWTLSPAMVDAMPGALNYYHTSSTDNDNLISGPSGYGYTYPNNWGRTVDLPGFVAKTEEYNVSAGIRVITIWNTITGGINTSVGQTFADNSSTLLGLTAQNTGGKLSIYNSKLPGMPLSCNYCTDEQAMKDHIASAASGWNGNEPRFVIIQAQPWNNVTPTSFKNVKNSLNSDYVVVRPDHIFQLIREHNKLPINPGGMTGEGEGLTGVYYNGQNFEEKITQRIDSIVSFDWGANSPVAGVDDDNFTVRWKGKIQPPFSGNYTFYITSDNGVKLWVNGEEVISNWPGNRNATTYTGTISSLVSGEKYDITLEYLEQSSSAQCKLEWASAFLPREIVPKSQLYPDLSSAINNPLADLKVYQSGQGVLNVEMNNRSAEPVSLTVYDVCGKTVIQQTSYKSQFNVSNLPKGIYLISIRTDKDLKTLRRIIQ